MITFFRGKVSRNWFLSCTDPEMENEPQSADQTASGPQEGDGESPEDSSLNSLSESSSPATSDNAAPSQQDSEPIKSKGYVRFDDECTYFDEDEEQSETEEDSKQDSKPLHPIVADWKEDMKAIRELQKEMMKKKGEL